jgi:hypothetical protein
MTAEFVDEPPAGVPPDFQEWPRSDQARLIAGRYRRAGLIAELLTRAGIEDAPEPDYDRKLTKKELAAIYCQMVGHEHAQPGGKQ